MKICLAAIVAAGLATGAMAQDAQSGSHNPAMKDSSAHKVAAPAKGHSSFTEGQAKTRIAKAGYTQIGDLKKTDAGWTGTAMKSGQSVTVTLDYKGNITSN
jgi:opacity protein-like surface antigen